MKYAGKGWRLLGVALMLLPSLILSAQDQPGADRPPSRTFISPDGAFRFKYPDSFVSCKRDPSQSDHWMPDQSCAAYIPVCADSSGSSDNTSACVAYPAAGLKPGTNFQAAAFSVNRLKPSTANTCMAGTETPSQAETPQTESINGVKFKVTKTDDVGAGNLMDGYAYRTFHGNVCYELEIRIASSNVANYDPGSVKSFDVEQVRHTLQSVLHSFTFLK